MRRLTEVGMQGDETASKGEQAEADRVPVEDTTRAVPDRRWRRDQR
ncbi:hypothetical protein [Micromonospora sp. NBC_00617]